MNPLVIYHADCPDGFAAATCAWSRFSGSGDYVPARYGDPPPGAAGREVYILDFSYMRPVLEALARSAASIVLLDHHKTAREELEGFEATGVRIVLSEEHSGVALAWREFYPGRTPSWLVDYVEDRDLWRFRLAHSRQVNAALLLEPRTFAHWTALLFGARPDRLIDDGNAILRFQDGLVEQTTCEARPVTIGGYPVRAAYTRVLISEVAGRLAEGAPFGATWYERADGTQVWSLRSREGGIDVSEVAKTYGGGGHRNAAGFTLSRDSYANRVAFATPSGVG